MRKPEKFKPDPKRKDKYVSTEDTIIDVRTGKTLSGKTPTASGATTEPGI